jgi:hypothetical protein
VEFRVSPRVEMPAPDRVLTLRAALVPVLDIPHRYPDGYDAR